MKMLHHIAYLFVPFQKWANPSGVHAQWIFVQNLIRIVAQVNNFEHFRLTLWMQNDSFSFAFGEYHITRRPPSVRNQFWFGYWFSWCTSKVKEQLKRVDALYMVLFDEFYENLPIYMKDNASAVGWYFCCFSLPLKTDNCSEIIRLMVCFNIFFRLETEVQYLWFQSFSSPSIQNDTYFRLMD